MNKIFENLADSAAELVQRALAIVPAARTVDWSQSIAGRWEGSGLAAGIVAHSDVDTVTLADLLCVDDQKDQIEQNTQQFLQGLPANNVLLWGARGTGKSSLIHGLLNAYVAEGLRLVEVNKLMLASLPEIVGRLQSEPYKFVLFCDDLSFEAEDASYKALKSALEGSVFRTSSNVLIMATSNRRHLLPEYMADNEQAKMVGNELHQGEAVEEKISLSDRFGLWLSFYPFKQDEYLAVVSHWINKLAQENDGRLQMDDEARAEALRWALARGVRSGRTAQHFARHWVGKSLLDLS